MISKVLVQWPASNTLRDVRTLELGHKGNTQIVQTPVALTDPLFPSFYVHAIKGEKWVEGFPLVHVGFHGLTRYDGVGWRAAGDLQVVHAFDAVPTQEELLRVLEEIAGPASPAHVDAVKQSVAKHLVEEAAANQKAMDAYKALVHAAEKANIPTVKLGGETREVEVDSDKPVVVPVPRLSDLVLVLGVLVLGVLVLVLVITA